MLPMYMALPLKKYFPTRCTDVYIYCLSGKGIFGQMLHKRICCFGNHPDTIDKCVF